MSKDELIITKKEFQALYEKHILTTPQAIEIMGITRPGLHRMVSSGRLEPFKKLSRETLFWREDIEKQAQELRRKYSRFK